MEPVCPSPSDLPSPPSPARAPPCADELAARVAVHHATLYAPGLGRALLERHGSARAVLAASPGRLASLAQTTPRIVSALTSGRALCEALAELRWAAEEGVHVLCAGGPLFPAALDGLPGMPLILYARIAPRLLGRPTRPDGPWIAATRGPGPLDGISVAVVGSRRPSPYGRRQAARFARGLALRGLGVVSGLARGIDAEAHRGALESGGWTLAVLGSGLDRIYPPENAPLARQIIEADAGAIVTEHPRGSPPRSHHFPLRNRILSALAEAVLVVEAGVRSGSLITVTHALEHGRSVYALPGRVDQIEAAGSLELLRDGALLAMGPEDILPDLPAPPSASGQAGDAGGKGLLRSAPGRAREPSAGEALDGPLGASISALFEESDLWHADALAERAGIDAGTLLRELSRWELEGRLARFPGGAWGLRSS